MNARISHNEGLTKKNMPVHIASDLEALEKSFNFPRLFSKTIFMLFAEQSNVFNYALDLMFYTKDFPRGRSCSLSQAIIESLKEWCRRNDLYSYLTLELKCLAITRALQQPNGSFVQLICETFRVKEDYEYFKLVIKQILSEYKFKEAFYLINSLDAERDFSLEEFVFPVFFLDKEPWVKRFFEKRSDLQLKFVQTLDSICRSGEDILNFVRSLPYENLPVRKHVYDPSRLQKLLANYIDHFNINIKECNNLYQLRCGSAMSYLVRKRYKEDSIGQEAFEEMIKNILAENPVLQKSLLMKLICFNDSVTAVKLATDFNLNKNDWPEILQTTSFTEHEPQETSVPANHASNYLKLRVQKADVHFIDTPEKCLEAISDISENYDVVGIDAEWRPNLGLTKENLSVYQLAVWDSVYLFDILTLRKSPNKKFWSCFVEKIFTNKNILKLGYGIKNDVQLLMSICIDNKSEYPKFYHILDLCEFFKKVRTCYSAVMDKLEVAPDPDAFDIAPTKGLSHLCYTILGHPLNKDEQFSDWERRPLRESQITYAALDAFCLLVMYEKLFHVLQDLQLDLEDVIKVTSQSSTKSEPSKKDKVQMKKDISLQSIPVSQFRVVVDNMLHGLGKYLRICGVDVVFIGNDDDHMRTIQIAESENRIILTSGTPYRKIKGYVPENMCYCVPPDENPRDQAAVTLKHFNVVCKETDIFSRCSVCSGNIYKNISNEELFTVWSALVNTDDALTYKAERKKQPFISKDLFISSDGVLESGVPIQLSALSPRVFETVKYFFVCINCGKVYWEGSHLSRVKKHISQYIEFERSGERNVLQCSGPVAECAEQILRSCIENENDPIQKNNPVSTSPESTIYKTPIMSFDINSSEDEDIDDIIHCG